MSQPSNAAPSLEIALPAEVAQLGRPSSLSPEKHQLALRLVRAGRNVEQVSEALGVDDCTFYDWQHQFPTFSEDVARARKQAAQAKVDRAQVLAEAAAANPGERGELARGAAVAIGHLQWFAERIDPATYGQRSALAIDARVTHEAGETVLSMGEIVARRAAARAAQGGAQGGNAGGA
jgi:hypothetical protein